MDERDLDGLASELVGQFDADRMSRADWEDSYVRGLDLLGLKFEDRSTPWEGACGVFHPMLSEAVIRFQAQTIQEIYPASGPVKTTIVGKITDDKTKQAHRVQNYLNYLITQRMTEYRTETEKLLFSLPIAGSAFRKVYFDPSMGRPCAMFVPAEDFVVSYGASDLSTCERATHVMKKTSNEIRKLQVAGFYSDIDLPAPSPDISEIQQKYDRLTGDSDNYEFDNRHTLLEMHVDIDLIGFEDTEQGKPTGIALPYVVTIDKSSRTILSIRRNWYEDDPKKMKRDHYVHQLSEQGCCRLG
jgi:peptidoglycan hydrolase-like protein with peptidoglycan-binding domain